MHLCCTSAKCARDCNFLASRYISPYEYSLGSSQVSEKKHALNFLHALLGIALFPFFLNSSYFRTGFYRILCLNTDVAYHIHWSHQSMSAAGLSLLLSACSYYGIEFDVKFNSAKSNVMVFCCNLLKDIPVPNFMLNGVAIDKVSNCKYLGHCINDKLIDDDDMARQRKQTYAQGNALVRKFYMCTETVRISLFKSYCSSLYTSSLWCKLPL